MALGASGSYARFGLNDENGGARGLGGWKLACPRFQQYPFESADLLDGVLACGSTAPVLIVAASLAPRPGRPDWNAFVAAVERRLAQDYSCEADLGVRLCKRLPK